MSERVSVLGIHNGSLKQKKIKIEIEMDSGFLVKDASTIAEYIMC